MQITSRRKDNLLTDDDCLNAMVTMAWGQQAGNFVWKEAVRLRKYKSSRDDDPIIILSTELAHEAKEKTSAQRDDKSTKLKVWKENIHA